MAMRYLLVSILVASLSPCFGQVKSTLRPADAVRVREAMRIADQFGDRLFSGYSKVPFAIVLVTDSVEFLLNHPNPSSDFIAAGKDSILNTEVYYRKRQFSPHFLATFPAVNGLSCIVVGTPENTGKNSSEWIITLLHEHFHQYQNADPNYYQSVNGLNLSGGDQSGMWMLTYPFPYDSLPVIDRYFSYTQALYKAVASAKPKKRKLNLNNYFAARQKFKETLTAPDYRYFSFQLWQEGLARYTEYKCLELLSRYQPSKEVMALPDFESFTSLKAKMYRAEMGQLLQNSISETKRISFYSAGFAEGLLLDQRNKSWRKAYLQDMFYIEKYSKSGVKN